jgi:hypothetical protein
VKELLHKHTISTQTDLVILDSSFIPMNDDNEIKKQSICVIEDIYEGAGSVTDNILNSLLDIVEFKKNVCIIDKNVLMEIDTFFYTNEDLQEKSYIVNKFVGDVLLYKITEDVGTFISIEFINQNFNINTVIPLKSTNINEQQAPLQNIKSKKIILE